MASQYKPIDFSQWVFLFFSALKSISYCYYVLFFVKILWAHKRVSFKFFFFFTSEDFLTKCRYKIFCIQITNKCHSEYLLEMSSSNKTTMYDSKKRTVIFSVIGLYAQCRKEPNERDTDFVKWMPHRLSFTHCVCVCMVLFFVSALLSSRVDRALVWSSMPIKIPKITRKMCVYVLEPRTVREKWEKLRKKNRNEMCISR